MDGKFLGCAHPRQLQSKVSTGPRQLDLWRRCQLCHYPSKGWPAHMFSERRRHRRLPYQIKILLKICHSVHWDNVWVIQLSPRQYLALKVLNFKLVIKWFSSVMGPTRRVTEFFENPRGSNSETWNLQLFYWHKCGYPYLFLIQPLS